MKQQPKNFNFEELPEFDDHKIISHIYDKESGMKGFIAIHRHGQNSNPSFGATRFWHYRTDEQAARDAIRLARIMSYKAAVAGLKYGGAKAVLMSPKQGISKLAKRKILKVYAHRVNLFNGMFITGTDVGLDHNDLKTMRGHSQFMVGVHGSPEKFTALGIFIAMKTCLKEVFGNARFANRSFAIQGLGKVGFELLKLLAPHTSLITVADINRATVRRAQQAFPSIKVIKPSEIHKQEVDVFAPCALSNVLNKVTIPELRCKIVCGGANNQLINARAGERLYGRNILYAPDYVINAGGLIFVADEYEHRNYNVLRINRRVRRIPRILAEIFSESKKSGKPTSAIADGIAEKIFNSY